jgi:hypothetical protein
MKNLKSNPPSLIAACSVLYAMVLSVIVLAVMSYAQTPTPRPTVFNHTVQVTRTAISTASPAPCIIGPNAGCGMVVKTPNGGPDATPYLCAVEFVANGQTITMSDGQGNSPYNAVLGSSGTVTNYTWGAPTQGACVAYVGGITLAASAAGALVSMTVVYNAP